MKSDETAADNGENPVDLCSVKHLTFIYTNINECQYVVLMSVSDTLLLRVIDWKQRLENIVSVSLNRLIELFSPILI